MPKQPIDIQRKNEHIFLAEKYYQATNKYFDEMKIIPKTIPDMSLKEVDLSTSFFGTKKSSAPIYINAMTGGSPQVTNINANLATLANKLNIPMAVGSMGNYLKYDSNEIEKSYQIVRDKNPDGEIWANVSANTDGLQAQKCIDLINADALQIHLNSAQEIPMNEGDNDFHWSKNIQDIIQHVSVPVIVKEVGFGMSHETVQYLKSLGVNNIDVSGRGGTNFAKIENTRNHNYTYNFLDNWGLTTLESLLDISNKDNINLMASGGVRTPLDAIKCYILGANQVGLAIPFLHSIQHNSLDEAIKYWQHWLLQLKQLLLLNGAEKVKDLSGVSYSLDVNLNNFVNQKR